MNILMPPHVPVPSPLDNHRARTFGPTTPTGALACIHIEGMKISEDDLTFTVLNIDHHKVKIEITKSKSKLKNRTWMKEREGTLKSALGLSFFLHGI